MPRRYVFADEAGNFDFSRKPSASKYFILTTVTAADCGAGHALLELRRELAWQGVEVDGHFHATTETQAVRDRVYATLQPFDFIVDSTILQKSKAMPHTRHTDEAFYGLAWWLHMRYLAPRIAGPGDELIVFGASVGTHARRVKFHGAVKDVVSRVAPTPRYRVACWDAISDPCLQVADYCAWAIQRKWERGDVRSHVLIAPKIRSEFEVFRNGPTEYY
jgi:hypothetical protein